MLYYKYLYEAVTILTACLYISEPAPLAYLYRARDKLKETWEVDYTISQFTHIYCKAEFWWK
jgi:hypothetical protein